MKKKRNENGRQARPLRVQTKVRSGGRFQTTERRDPYRNFN